jgi:hypothetical protein
VNGLYRALSGYANGAKCNAAGVLVTSGGFVCMFLSLSLSLCVAAYESGEQAGCLRVDVDVPIQNFVLHSLSR